MAPAGTHAEDVFETAFIDLGFKICGRDVSEFKGIKVKGKEGKEPPNLDFVLEIGSCFFGVDIKNWIHYEYNTRQVIIDKLNVAIQLKIIPVIIARYIDKDILYAEIISKGGRYYVYEELLIPPTFRSLADDAIRFLGYKVLAVDKLPSYKMDFIRNVVLKV